MRTHALWNDTRNSHLTSRNDSRRTFIGSLKQTITEANACQSDADLMAERTSLNGKTGARLGPDVIHMAQRYLYHPAQFTYLRRIRDRE